MPETLSLSAGVSLGLLAGIVSGVCYLFANGFTRTGSEQKVSNRRCIAPKEDNICNTCGGNQLGGVLPCICIEKTPVKFESGAWFLRQAQRALSLMPWSFSTDRLEQIEEEECEGPSSSEGRGDLHNVREFLEAISTRLTGPLEGTRVAPLYDHPAYVSMFERHHAAISATLAALATALRDALRHLPPHSGPRTHGPTLGAGGAHAQLKRLVARVVEEAAALPALARYAAEPHTPTESSTYEDLLATAILNKVIERYQTENGSGGRSSGIHSASASPSPSDRSSPRSLHSRNIRDITPPLREEDDASDWEEGEGTDDALEVPRRVPFPEYGGDIVHATDDEYRDFDEVSGSDIQAVDGTWEENWLFQKKKIKNIQSAPVPMLVPNSTTQYRALIGDRDADDTTDLSDNASDTEDHEIEYKSDVKKVLDSKHVIGGKPNVDDVLDFEPDSLTIIDESQNFENSYSKNVLCNDIDDIKSFDYNSITQSSINEDKVNNESNNDSILILDVDSGPITKTEFNLKEQIHRTAFNGHGMTYSETENVNGELTDEHDNQKPLISAYNREITNALHFESEKEYEETVTVPVQRYADSLRRKHFKETEQCTTPKTDEDDLIPGTIAYRERKKWLNYVDMPNNPYSPEAIKKRLSAKSTSSLFDTLTTTNNNGKLSSCEDLSKSNHGNFKENTSKGAFEKRQLKCSLSSDEVILSGRRSMSPLHKVLRNVLSEEVPQYKRYGRDYYIKEARSSSGERKKGSFSGTSSLSSSINKSTSLENFDREFASPVSASSSLSDLEATALHHSVARVVISPRHASPNFAINPIFENTDRQDTLDYENDGTDIGNNVRHTDEGDGFVENEDIVRLKIPKKPEITEDLFERYTDVRRSNTMRSDDFYVRPKRRPGLNFTFGGSGLLIQQFNSIAANQQYTKFADKDIKQISITTIPAEYKNEIIIEYEDANEQTLFSSKPTYSDEDTDRKFEEILQSAYNTDKILTNTERVTEALHKSSNSIENSLSSSSAEDSIKIYNVQTGEIVKCKPEDKVSRRYETPDRNDNIDIPDNNISGETLDRLSDSGNSDVRDDAVIIESSEEHLNSKTEIDDLPAQLPNVKELAKKFVSMESLAEPVKVSQPNLKRQKSKENIFSSDFKDRPANKLTYMHSLTARSISKEFREELKLSMPTPHTVPGGSKDIPEGTEDVTRESSRPGSPVPEPGTIKSKLAFFESLKSKFSSK